MKPTGRLILVPTTLADLKAAGGPETAPADMIAASLPQGCLAVVAGLSCFAAENAKTARSFLKQVGTALPLQQIEVFEIGHAPDEKLLKPLVDKLLGGMDVGVLAEAGCPGVADPGAALVRQAHRHGIAVLPLVGPSSLLLALMASGLEGQRFAFSGYAPVKSPAREAHLRKLEVRSARERETQILIETPYRNAALLQALCATLRPDTLLCVAADLTLPGQWITTKPVEGWRKAHAAAEQLARRPAVFLFLAN